jgi:hypothetical protein
MRKKLLSLNEIEKTWWWRREEIQKNGVPGVDWKRVEEAARNYELLCRWPDRTKFTQNYLSLDPEQKTIVHVLWMDTDDLPYRYVWNPEQFEEKGWTPIYEHQRRQWNLNVAERILIKEFIREIRTLRKIQKIPARHWNKGKKHRGVSWNLVECLDLNLHKIGGLDDSQRHTASEAKKKAKQFAAEYERALAVEREKPALFRAIGSFDDPMPNDGSNPLQLALMPPD